jgi:hypothetical protein
MLHPDRAGRGGVECQPMTGSVERLPDPGRKGQEPGEHRRNPLARGDLLLEEDPQCGGGIESGHDHRGGADALLGGGEGEGRAVVQRTGREVAVLFDEPEADGDLGTDGRPCTGAEPREGAKDPLGPAGGARGVQKHLPLFSIGDGIGDLLGEGGIEGFSHRQRDPQTGEPGGGLGPGLTTGLRADECADGGVFEDVADLRRQQVAVDGDDVEARPHGSPENCEDVRLVAEDERNPVAAAEARPAQRPGQAVGGGVEGAVADALDRPGGIRVDDHHRLGIGPDGGPGAEIGPLRHSCVLGTGVLEQLAWKA